MTRYPLRGGTLAACLALAALAPAGATEILFDTHSAWTPPNNVVSGKPTAAAVIGSAFDGDDYNALGILFGRAGVSAGAVVYKGGGYNSANGICGLDAAGNVTVNCTGDQYFSFVTTDQTRKAAATAHLSFAVGDNGPDLDSFIIHVYDINNVELEARTVASINYTVQSFDYGGINRVWVQWTGAGGGYFIDTINFDTPTVPARVPEPAGITLFGLGLAALLARRAQVWRGARVKRGR